MNAELIDRQVMRKIMGSELRDLELRQLRGGFVASSVTHAKARCQDQAGKTSCRSFVIKSLEGAAAREAAIHERLAACGVGSLAPKLWAVHHAGGDHCRLYMEAIRPIRRWPWRELEYAQRVLDALASLHESDLTSMAGLLTDWDYEEELITRAWQGVATFDRVCRRHRITELLRFGPFLRRAAHALPAMRGWLMSIAPFGRTTIHGDVHPGNVMICTRGGRATPVFLDWGRARVGSPLEDVSSWLQSLAYWEPQAHRRHDSLLAGYLASRGLPVSLGRELRRAYWVAAASNLLAGALSIHLEQLGSGEWEEPRQSPAFHATKDALRVIRRADAHWRGQEGSRGCRRTGQPGVEVRAIIEPRPGDPAV